MLSRPDCPLTVRSRTLGDFISEWADDRWHSSGWQLDDRQSASRLSTSWQAVDADGHRLAEVCLRAELLATTGRHAGLDILLDVLLPRPFAGPYLDLGTLGRVIMDMTGTLWGAAGETLSREILGKPLWPPAALAVSLSCLHETGQRIDEVIDFGSAVLAPGNTPGTGQEFDEVGVDRSFLSATAQRDAVRDWLIQLGINHGYHGVEAEVAAQMPE